MSKRLNQLNKDAIAVDGSITVGILYVGTGAFGAILPAIRKTAFLRESYSTFIRYQENPSSQLIGRIFFGG